MGRDSAACAAFHHLGRVGATLAWGMKAGLCARGRLIQQGKAWGIGGRGARAAHTVVVEVVVMCLTVKQGVKRAHRGVWCCAPHACVAWGVCVCLQDD